ncbi:MAG: hypothetical protein AAFU80_18445 [Pseudomonadota bacterium]
MTNAPQEAAANEDRFFRITKADKLIGFGGGQNDVMNGGRGADQFVFFGDRAEGFDRIERFQLTVDQIVISEFSAGSYREHNEGTLVELDSGTRILLVGRSFEAVDAAADDIFAFI